MRALFDEDEPIQSREGRALKERRDVPQESLVRVFVNGDFLRSMLCTPGDVKELAAGWLYAKGQGREIRRDDDKGGIACPEPEGYLSSI